MSIDSNEFLDKIVVSYVNDPKSVSRFYRNCPGRLKDDLEHINGVLNIPPKDEELVLAELYLEQRSNSRDPVKFQCSPKWTILTAKLKICETYPEYNVENLYPLYRRNIAKDWWYLKDCGIEQDGDPLYVYIYMPRSRSAMQRQQRKHPNVDSLSLEMLSSPSPPFSHGLPGLQEISFQPPLKDIPFETMDLNFASNLITEDQMKNNSMGSLWTCKICTFLNESWRKECVMCNSPQGSAPGGIFDGLPDLKSVAAVGWKCPKCTFINEPTRPGCELCSTQKPADYVMPDDYVPSEREQERLDRESRMEDEAKKQQSLERQQNYSRLLSAEDSDIITSTEPIECMICFTETEPEESIVLRECLHKFCKDCISAHVKNSEEATVTCPYMDDDYNCNNPITHREIKALLSEEDFQKYLDRGLMQAEKESENSFHCKTPDCHGWCVYEDDVNNFHCPVCDSVNCILCKAIHKDMNCKEYQEELTRKAATDEEAKKTKSLLERMLKSGDALNCPKCNIIIQKKVGCDWIRCSMCKEEICWVTKGPRWGPKGAGDTTGGCKCRVNGKPCHPNCKNCH